MGIFLKVLVTCMFRVLWEIWIQILKRDFNAAKLVLRVGFQLKNAFHEIFHGFPLVFFVVMVLFYILKKTIKNKFFFGFQHLKLK